MKFLQNCNHQNSFFRLCAQLKINVCMCLFRSPPRPHPSCVGQPSACSLRLRVCFSFVLFIHLFLGLKTSNQRVLLGPHGVWQITSRQSSTFTSAKIVQIKSRFPNSLEKQQDQLQAPALLHSSQGSGFLLAPLLALCPGKWLSLCCVTEVLALRLLVGRCRQRHL